MTQEMFQEIKAATEGSNRESRRPEAEIDRMKDELKAKKGVSQIQEKGACSFHTATAFAQKEDCRH